MSIDNDFSMVCNLLTMTCYVSFVRRPVFPNDPAVPKNVVKIDLNEALFQGFKSVGDTVEPL